MVSCKIIFPKAVTLTNSYGPAIVKADNAGGFSGDRTYPFR